MEIEERIKKIKEKNLSKALEEAKIGGVKLEMPLLLIEKIVKKIDTIEEGAEKNYTRKKLDELLHSLKFDAETLSGLSVNDLAFKNHEHYELNELLKKDIFNEFRKQLNINISKFSANLVSLYEDFDKLKNDETLGKKIEIIKKQSDNLKNKIQAIKHNTLDNLEWSKAGHIIDIDIDVKGFGIKNLADPKDQTDATNKRYVDATIQRRIPTYLGSAGVAGTVVSGTGGHTIEDEGIPLTARTNLNFVGAGVTTTDDAGNDATVVTIPLTDITGKANVALDNLASVAINTSLISDTDNTDNLGSLAKAWNNTYSNKVFTTVIAPHADGATAFQINKADGTTNILNIDTTNSFVGIKNIAPTMELEVGSATAGGNVSINATLGSNLISNGTFNSDLTNWSGGNWAWNAGSGNGYALHTAGVGNSLTSTLAATAGATYKITYTIRNMTVGGINPTFGGQTGTLQTTNGTFTIYIVATTTGALSFAPISSSFDGGIDDVQVQLLSNGLLTVGNGLTVTAGQLLIPDGTQGKPGIAFGNDTTTGFSRPAVYSVYLNIAGGRSTYFSIGSIWIISNAALLQFGSIGDVSVTRDAANTLALRASTAAQQFNIYNTYTSATTYERAEMNWIANANVFTIQTTKGSGGGTLRNISLQPSGGNVGIGVTVPTAVLHLLAGTATASTAPLKFTSGPLLTASEAGAMEFLTDDFYGTITTNAIRRKFVMDTTGRSAGATAAVASVATYTLGAADASFEISANVLITTSSAEAFTVTCAYTDEGNTARTITLNFQLLAGTIGTGIAFANGTVPYEGIPLHIRCKASTAITIATTGTFTGCTYNVEGIIKKI